MTITKKAQWSVMSILILAALLFAWHVISGQTTSRYNENPDVSSKIIGSLDSSGTRFPPKSMEELIDRSEFIVIGTVTTDAINIKRPIRSGTPLDQKFEDKFNKTPTYTTAAVQVQVEEVLYGEIDQQEITYSQLGNAKSHSKQTKVKKRDQVVLFLKKSQEDGRYTSIAFEEGVFTILPENKLLSQSPYKFAAKYDEISLDILKEDVASIVNKIK